MRNLGFNGAGRGSDASLAQNGHRPEVLRRKTIANNALILVGAAGLLMPAAIWALLLRQPLAFILAATALVAGMLSLALHRNGRIDGAAGTQVVGLVGCGFAIAAFAPGLAALGLGVTLMGPVLAALVSRSPIRQLSWLAVPPALILVFYAGLSGAATQINPMASVMAASLAFATAIAVVMHSANRINTAYVVHDKSQISAYKHLVEHVQDAVLRFSCDGQILVASRSVETLFGCPRYQLTGAGLAERLHVTDRPAYLTAYADAAHAGRCRSVEVRMRKDDPRLSGLPQFIWVEVRFSPIDDRPAGEQRHEVIAMLRDITERRDAEAAMIAARAAAEEASIAKSRFLATMGHELRTPLNAVVGFSEMMANGIGGELSHTHREYAGLIHQSGRHLLDVVGMLLDMSRIDAGKFEIETAPIRADEMMQASFAMVATQAKARNVTLTLEVEPSLPGLVADERACRQIMINLLSNAIKFSHEGATVAVSVRRLGQSIRYAVRDTGIGMAPMALERIGEPFFQVQDDLNRKYEGTGLGLSIVKGLVELHGGTLRAMSEIGSGTTMSVLLPINGPAIKSEETATVTPLHREPAAEPGNSWQNEKRKAQ